MPDTDQQPAQQRPRPRSRSSGGSPFAGCLGALFNVLSVVLLLLTCASAGGAAALYQYPGLVAMLPPPGAWVIPTQPLLLPGLATSIANATRPAGTPVDGDFPTLPPEWTPTDTPTITPTPLPATETPIPTNTRPGPSQTPSRTPTSTTTPTRSGPTPTATRTRSAFNFELQNGSVTYLANFINGSGCNWFGLVGQAFDVNGRPIIGLTVHVEGGGLSLDALTGSQPAISTGGYEIPLGNHPVETSDVYRLQLRNNTGTALSDTLVIKTFGDCKRNLVMVNFVQNH